METKQPEHSEHSYNYIQALPVLRGLLISRRACTLKCDKEPQSGAPIFVLVHGTWATRASWTLPDSKLRKKLESWWPEGGIYRFDWSGTNGVRHRLLASGVLSEKLNELVVRYPSSKVVVISHSHGGNVVAWASSRLKRRLAAAVYMNTPFNQVLLSYLTRIRLRIVLWFGGSVLAFLLATFFPELLFPPDSGARKIAIGIGIAISFAWLFWLQITVPPWIEAVRERLAEVSNGSRKISKELLASVVGDEPRGALNFVSLGQWLGRWIARMALIGVIVCAVLGAGARVIAKSTADRDGMFLIWFSLATCFAYLLLQISGYGLVQGLVALDSSIAVTTRPVGQPDFLPPDLLELPWSSRYPLQLRHSFIYKSDDAIERIVHWIDTALRVAAAIAAINGDDRSGPPEWE